MTKTLSADVSDEELESGTEYSDRYVYSDYFVPLVFNHMEEARTRFDRAGAAQPVNRGNPVRSRRGK